MILLVATARLCDPNGENRSVFVLVLLGVKLSFRMRWIEPGQA
jgi:hypothetical protein